MMQNCIVYWMSRDQRMRNNRALSFAQKRAMELKTPLAVCFCLAPQFLEATIRQYKFMLDGLKELQKDLEKKNIGFVILSGDPAKELPKFLKKANALELVTDFDPLRIKLKWKKAVAARIKIPNHEIDTHNIVPCKIASPKQEFGAYTFRPKIGRLLSDYLEDIPAVRKHPYGLRSPKIAWDKIERSLKVDRSVPPIKWLKSGENAAGKVLNDFIKNRLDRYDKDKNDPSKDAVSNLSPYLHFGQISALTIYNEVTKSSAPKSAKESFLEELVVRRELSDNYCYYNKHYDSFEGLPNWAKKTLNEHRRDARQYIYSLHQLEHSRTHDELWNAAQTEMVKTGKMHGYIRMYWAKKILEWTRTPEEAIKLAIYLNDKYELDGRDPNGYVGILWAIGGLHDRAWGERPIFGKIRFMSYKSQITKFDHKEYLCKISKSRT